MKRVTGIGGIFFKCKDVDKVKAWYEKHLGLIMDDYGSLFVSDSHDQQSKQYLQWSPFPENTTYFQPSDQSYMINYRVADLTALVDILRAEKVTILDEIQSFDYGKFVHILDIEGRKIELWEPNDETFNDPSYSKTT
ncbi:VOC family protein [Membranihabitans marinus]|uniref:VOC family protein n=1 Tax=Membranihabitans marinus TaxID=1227546 RepID=UPI001F3E0B4E|nr:VOC family protein [Membranihabitans marinus]